MGSNAFETAVEVLAEGFVGYEALQEWMGRISSAGQRYCPIAAENILSTLAEDDGPAFPRFEVEGPAPVEVVEEVEFVEEEPEGFAFYEPVVFEPSFEGEFSFGGVPGEPVEELEEV